MDKLLAKIPLWFPHDKCLHFIGGLLTFAMLVFFVPPKIALIIVVLVGILKEWLYDARRPTTHTVDSLDAVATTLGGCAGWMLILLNAHR